MRINLKKTRPYLLKSNADRESLPVYLQRIKYTLGRVNPSTLFFEEEQIESVNLSVMVLDFKSFSLSGAIYNLMFLTEVDSRLVLGSFNCPFDEWEDWKPVMLTMLQSMEAVEKGE